VSYRSKEDQISLEHKAHGREGFAIGALEAARWIIGKKGVFGMADMLDL
ncbi:MAG: 4-hydroxy-tetrahydrodipicolinate reductase, partial [Saprospiraceae bacterium]|nr:4-hydroxy-tetrahydrodipicolinate reductase [Saprospiraceae bacterium]